MKIIIEIEDDLVQAQVVALTQKKEDRAHRETLKAYFQEHHEIVLPEEAITEIDEEFPTVMAVLAIGQASKELGI